MPKFLLNLKVRLLFNTIAVCVAIPALWVSYPTHSTWWYLLLITTALNLGFGIVNTLALLAPSQAKDSHHG